MTLQTYNRYVDSATAVNQTAPTSEPTTSIPGSNKGGAQNKVGRVDNMIVGSRRERRAKHRAKHRITYRGYSLGVWKAYALNRYRWFIRPQVRAALSQFAIKLKHFANK